MREETQGDYAQKSRQDGDHVWSPFQHLAPMLPKDVASDHQRCPVNPGVATGKPSTLFVQSLETYLAYPLPLDIHANLRLNQDSTNTTSFDPINLTFATDILSLVDRKSQYWWNCAANTVASQPCPSGWPSYAELLDSDDGSNSMLIKDPLSRTQWQFEMMSNPESTSTRSFYHNPALAAVAFVGLGQAKSRRGLKTFLSNFPCSIGLLSFVSSAKAAPLPTRPSPEVSESPRDAAIGIGVAISLTILSIAATAALAFRYRRMLWALSRKTKSESIDVSRRFLEAIRKNDKVIAGSGMILSLIAWNIPLTAEGKDSPWSLVVGLSWFAATATFMIRQCHILKHQEGYVAATVAVTALLSVVHSALQRGNADNIITLLTFWSSIVAFLLAYVWPRR